MNTALLILLLSTQTCDTVTTNVALSRPGFSEGNPLLGKSRTKINTIKVSVNVIATVGWWKNRHKPGAKVIPIALSAAGGAACAWNLKQLAR